MTSKVGSELSDWLQLKDDALSENKNLFFNFICTWIAFNALNNQMWGIEQSDRVKINKTRVDAHFQKMHEHLMSESLYSESVRNLDGVIDMKNQKRTSIKNVNSWADVLEAVYTVRNNLFHGAKRTADKRDIQCVRASEAIIGTIVRNHISKP